MTEKTEPKAAPTLPETCGSTVETLQGWAALRPDGTLIGYYPSKGEAEIRCRHDFWTSDAEKNGWCRCGKREDEPSPGCVWHDSRVPASTTGSEQ